MIVIQNLSSGYSVDAGAIILWYGIGADLPAGWSVYSSFSGVFVKGANSVNLTPSGTFTHHHANPSATGTSASHAHGYAAGGSFGTCNAENNNKASGSWDTIQNHSHSVSVSSFGSVAGHAHSLGNTNDATVYPPYRRLYFIQTNEARAVPVGGIILFKAPYADRPDGFNLCNGGSYGGITTPDLRDKFVYGAAAESDVGLTGGAETHVHSQPNTGSGGGHTHPVSGSTTGRSGNVSSVSQYTDGATSGVARDHGHSWSNNTNSDPDHVHSVPNTNSGTKIPPYLKLYFLMRTE